MKKMKKYRGRIWSKPLLSSKTRDLKYTTPMEEVNLGTVEEPRITYISSLLPSYFKEGIITIL